MPWVISSAKGRKPGEILLPSGAKEAASRGAREDPYIRVPKARMEHLAYQEARNKEYPPVPLGGIGQQGIWTPDRSRKIVNEGFQGIGAVEQPQWFTEDWFGDPDTWHGDDWFGNPELSLQERKHDRFFGTQRRRWK